MKKLLLAAAIMLTSSTAYAVYHSWTLIDEQTTSENYHVCTWKCNGIGHGGEHYTTTSSPYGSCRYSRPN